MPNCGTIIYDLTFVPMDVYKRDWEIEDLDQCKLIEEDFDKPVEIPSQYVQINDLTDDVKKEIENLFRTFGAYSAKELGQLLNPIADELVIQGKEELDLNKLKTSGLESIQNNAIVCYIFKE
jgi:hypothetical protein